MLIGLRVFVVDFAEKLWDRLVFGGGFAVWGVSANGRHHSFVRSRNDH